MQVTRLDHVNLRTKQLSKMIEWYDLVLGLKVGKRPSFPFGGAWLYSNGNALVHLVEVQDDPGAGSEGSLKLEHFALSAEGQPDFEEKLKSLGEKFQTSELTEVGIIQYNIWDPDGNHIHVDFRTDV